MKVKFEKESWIREYFEQPTLEDKRCGLIIKSLVCKNYFPWWESYHQTPWKLILAFSERKTNLFCVNFLHWNLRSCTSPYEKFQNLEYLQTVVLNQFIFYKRVSRGHSGDWTWYATGNKGSLWVHEEMAGLQACKWRGVSLANKVLGCQGYGGGAPSAGMQTKACQNQKSWTICEIKASCLVRHWLRQVFLKARQAQMHVFNFQRRPFSRTSPLLEDWDWCRFTTRAPCLIPHGPAAAAHSTQAATQHSTQAATQHTRIFVNKLSLDFYKHSLAWNLNE